MNRKDVMWCVIALFVFCGLLALDHDIGHMSENAPDQLRESLRCPVCGADYGLLNGPEIYTRRYVDAEGDLVLVPSITVLMCQDCWDSMDPIHRMNTGIKVMEKRMRDGRSAHDLYYCSYETIHDNLVLAALGLPQTADIVVLPFVSTDEHKEDKECSDP